MRSIDIIKSPLNAIEYQANSHLQTNDARPSLWILCCFCNYF